jgi:membrane protein required for colicin V production
MTAFDIAVVAIIGISALIAMWMGFVRLVLALAGWVGAAFATMYGFAYARPIARQWVSPELLADAVAGAGIFIATLIVITFISHAIGRQVRQSALSALDRSLGLLAGLAIGAVVVSLGYLALAWAIDLPPKTADQPQWIREAKSRPVVETGADALRWLAPASWGGGGKTPARDGAAQQKTLQKLLEPETTSGAAANKKGYTDRERQEMDRLFRGQK